MNQGIITSTRGLFELVGPYDLDAERIGWLKSAGPLTCGCRPEEGLSVTVVAGTVRPHVRRVRELDRHALDCVFHRHYTRINRGVDKWTEEILEGDAMDGAVLTGFHELTRALFSRAYSASWVTASGNPPVTAVMGQVETLIRERAFLTAGQSLARAACTRGLKVLFGLVPCLPLFAWSPPAVSSELRIWVPVWPADAAGECRQPICLNINQRLVAAAAKAASVYGRPIQGPYFFVAVLDTRAWCPIRFSTLPVGFAGGLIAAVDSHQERHLLARYWREGRQVYKPLRLRELNVMPEVLRPAAPAKTTYLYRPDFILSDSRPIEVVELKGFEATPGFDGVDDGVGLYLRTFQEKAGYWNHLAAAGHCRFIVENCRRAISQPELDSDPLPPLWAA